MVIKCDENFVLIRAKKASEYDQERPQSQINPRHYEEETY